jgi:lipopolysaccharide heptosyltransferase I
MRILLVRLGSLGDLVHGLPLVAALHDTCPDARLDWVVDARHRALLDLVPMLDRLVTVEPSAAGFLAAARALRARAYDVTLDLQGLWKSAVLARASGAARIIGFPRAHLREPWARLFYSETCAAVAGPHVIDKNLSLLEPLGAAAGPVGPVRFPLEVPPSPVVDEVRRRLGLRTDEGFMLVNPGAAWPNKRWAPERFGRVAADTARQHGLRSSVLWGPGEEPLAAAVAAASTGSAVAAPRTSVADVLALAHAARLVISGDTGPLHLAAAVGAPVVALFGPTDPARNGPWAEHDISLSRYERCACHYRRRCTRDVPCLADIGEPEVCRAIATRLAHTPVHD